MKDAADRDDESKEQYADSNSENKEVYIITENKQ
jgi:hypothetical protein